MSVSVLWEYAFFLCNVLKFEQEAHLIKSDIVCRSPDSLVFDDPAPESLPQQDNSLVSSNTERQEKLLQLCMLVALGSRTEVCRTDAVERDPTAIVCTKRVLNYC